MDNALQHGPPSLGGLPGSIVILSRFVLIFKTVVAEASHSPSNSLPFLHIKSKQCFRIAHQLILRMLKPLLMTCTLVSATGDDEESVLYRKNMQLLLRHD